MLTGFGEADDFGRTTPTSSSNGSSASAEWAKKRSASNSKATSGTSKEVGPFGASAIGNWRVGIRESERALIDHDRNAFRLEPGAWSLVPDSGIPDMDRHSGPDPRVGAPRAVDGRRKSMSHTVRRMQPCDAG